MSLLYRFSCVYLCCSRLMFLTLLLSFLQSTAYKYKYLFSHLPCNGLHYLEVTHLKKKNLYYFHCVLHPGSVIQLKKKISRHANLNLKYLFTKFLQIKIVLFSCKPSFKTVIIYYMYNLINILELKFSYR